MKALEGDFKRVFEHYSWKGALPSTEDSLLDRQMETRVGTYQGHQPRQVDSVPIKNTC